QRGCHWRSAGCRAPSTGPVGGWAPGRDACGRPRCRRGRPLATGRAHACRAPPGKAAIPLTAPRLAGPTASPRHWSVTTRKHRPEEGDAISDVGGVRLFVDSVSARYIKGAEIDFVDSLMGGGFTVHNPNAVSSCSCGSSFDTGGDGGTARGCSH